MSTNRVARPSSAKVVPMTSSATNVSDALQQYGYGAMPFIGTENSFYERHLVFDRAIDPKVASARERFEAFSHSVRDILAKRWVQTKNTYERENAKRIYYLSMEFLIGRSLANNITNLLLDPLLPDAAQEHGIDWLELVEQEPVQPRRRKELHPRIPLEELRHLAGQLKELARVCAVTRAAGSEMTMVRPPPGVSRASRVPPIASVRPRDSARPRPTPGDLPVSPSCWNGRNAWSHWDRAMPGPRSTTSSSTRSPRAPAVTAHRQIKSAVPATRGQLPLLIVLPLPRLSTFGSPSL